MMRRRERRRARAAAASRAASPSAATRSTRSTSLQRRAPSSAGASHSSRRASSAASDTSGQPVEVARDERDARAKARRGIGPGQRRHAALAHVAPSSALLNALGIRRPDRDVAQHDGAESFATSRDDAGRAVVELHDVFGHDLVARTSREFRRARSARRGTRDSPDADRPAPRRRCTATRDSACAPSSSAPRPFRRTKRARVAGSSLRHAIGIREREQHAACVRATRARSASHGAGARVVRLRRARDGARRDRRRRRRERRASPDRGEATRCGADVGVDRTAGRAKHVALGEQRGEFARETDRADVARANQHVRETRMHRERAHLAPVRGDASGRRRCAFSSRSNSVGLRERRGRRRIEPLQLERIGDARRPRGRARAARGRRS